MTLDEARGMALQSLFYADLKRIPFDELGQEREYCSLRLAEAIKEPAAFGDTMIPMECWQAIYGERIAWLDMEINRRKALGVYTKAGGTFTREYLEALVSRIDLAAFIVERHPETRLKLYAGGAGTLGLCPWHADEHPSLGVWARPEWHWFCFVCLEGGDVFNWLLKQEATGFKDAVRIAATYAGVPLPQARPRALEVYGL